jgi:uncharacterized paraquat-inducible protein A
VAERILGRALQPNEEVHHLDGDKSHNVPWNLAILTKAEHARLHQVDRPKLNRWSTNYDACVICGGTDQKHSSKGRCRRCHGREAAREKRARLRAALVRQA